MQADARHLLERIVTTPRPSGFEEQIQQTVRAYLRPVADELRTDVHGNLIACRNPGGRPRVMLAGHCDQIGLLVTQIDDEGFIYAQPIGGWDPQQLVGQRMTIWGAEGPVPAVIARKPIHLLSDEERKQVVKLEELWLDVGARDKAEAQQLVKVGDPITFQLQLQEMHNRLVNGPGLDNASGLWVVVEAMRRAGPQLSCALYTVSTVQEEIGLRGAQTSAFGIEPQVGIAVDVTHATDCPTIDRRQRGELFLGRGPVVFCGPNMNRPLTRRLEEVAAQHGIAYQRAAFGRATPNDANVLQTSRAGVATALVSIPNRYMHSGVEVVSLEDLDRAADLLAAFVSGLGPDDDFTP